MEGNKINIIFTGTKLNEEVQINVSATFNELILKFFEKMKKKPEDVNSKVFFEIGDKRIKWDSKASIKELSLENNSTIKVIDDNNLLKPVVTRRKERRVVKDNNSTNNEPESNISVLADMALLGIDAEDDIEDDRDELKEYEKGLDKTNDEHVFVLGLIGKYLDKVLGIYSRINEDNEFSERNDKKK